MSADLDGLLEVLADAVAERVIAKLMTGQREDWIDQGRSALGRRKHCARVRARMASGKAGAAIVGRRHLLTRAALDEEMGATASPAKEHTAEDPLSAYRKRRA